MLISSNIFWNKGNFHFTSARYIITPTGSNDTDNLANTGLNYWTVDTNAALTHLREATGQDYSINIGYTYNTENPDTDYQTGQELHIYCLINQYLSESWAVGVHGFYVKQLTGDGAALGDFNTQATGIGPAILCSTEVADR